MHNQPIEELARDASLSTDVNLSRLGDAVIDLIACNADELREVQDALNESEDALNESENDNGELEDQIRRIREVLE